MSKRKRTAASHGPLTIAVHGPGVAIDMTFDDAAKVGEVCDQLSQRWSQSAPGPTPATSTTVEVMRLREMLIHVCPGVRDEDLDAAIDVLLQERARRTGQGATAS